MGYNCFDDDYAIRRRVFDMLNEATYVIVGY